MRASINGTIVEKREYPWDFRGQSGVSYQLYVRADGQSAAEAAQLVKVTPRQFAAYAEGDYVALPVDINANTQERQGAIVGARLSVSLPPDYDPARAGAALS